MDTIKTFTEVIELVTKYISISMSLLCISICSFLIYYFHIENIYLIISIYSSVLFLIIMIKNICTAISNKYYRYCLKNKKWLHKTWIKLSENEQELLKDMYLNNCSKEYEYNNKFVLLLQQRGMIMHPTQLSDGFHLMYIMQPWVELMVKQNIEKEN